MILEVFWGATNHVLVVSSAVSGRVLVPKMQLIGAKWGPSNPVLGPRGPKVSLQVDPQNYPFYYSESTISAPRREPKTSPKQTEHEYRKNAKLQPTQEEWGRSPGAQKNTFGTPRGAKGPCRGPLGGPKRPSEIINIPAQI